MPSQFFKGNFKKTDVYGVVIDIPMPNNVLTTMVCFINGAANLYFNNGNEYTGASQKYRNLVQATHNMVANANILVPKCEKVKSYDIPRGRIHNIFLLTRSGIYKTELHPGVIPETEPENFIYIFFPFMFGIYPYAAVTDKQKAAMKDAGVDYVYQSVYEITYNCLIRLLGD